MKKIILSTITLFILISANAQSSETLDSYAKPKVRFRWSGIFGNKKCEGGDCGLCIGLCVMFDAKTAADAAKEPAQNEIGDLAIKVISKDQILAIPSQSCDNGDGTVTLIDDLVVDNSFSSKLGKSNVKLLKGKYSIDYSDKNYKFGKIVFNYSSN